MKLRNLNPVLNLNPVPTAGNRGGVGFQDLKKKKHKQANRKV